MESFSNIKTLSIFNSLEGDNDLFITGYNSLLTNDDTKAARDFYLLLMIYVNYFCFPVLSFFLNGLSGFGNSVQGKINEGANFVYMGTAFFIEVKECISKLFFSQKEQVEFNILSRNLYRKSVLQ